MRLRVAPCFDRFSELLLAKLELDRRDLPTKQLVAQPYPVGVDDISFAIVRDLLYPAFETISCDLATMNALGFPRQPHNFTKFVQRAFRLRRKRRKNVAQVARKIEWYDAMHWVYNLINPFTGKLWPDL